ncbi:sulfurtransferase TusA family protein [Piscirickettsia litoralis]|uniref:Response regulator SirA n=1 Tax=Piscirickettsia litoralis TaxID=1891921 RepID=A0ABX3A3P6_9GAMM|nr:sulfurtransferase TusA family protein [Piscirickettsia litoralis]ODN43471.1 response regulator SirA [Piscirickettsia litoralis]
MRKADAKLDVTDLRCPFPLLRTKKALKCLQSGEILEVTATDPSTQQDFSAFVKQTGHALLEMQIIDDVFYYWLQKK